MRLTRKQTKGRNVTKINAFLQTLKKGKRKVGPVTHELKCWASVFSEKWHNKKNWEIRLNDRNYKIGDILIEREFFPGANNGLGAFGTDEIHEEVIYILNGGFGLQPGFIIMSTRQIKRVCYRSGKRIEVTTPLNRYENP